MPEKPEEVFDVNLPSSKIKVLQEQQHNVMYTAPEQFFDELISVLINF